MSDQRSIRSDPHAATEVAGMRPRPPSLPYPFVHRLAHALSFCLGAMAFVCVLTMDFIGPDLYTRSFERSGLPVSYTEIHKNHGRLLFVSRAAVLVGVTAAILWLLWQYRSQANVRALGTKRMRFGPVTSAAMWFVPVANLVLPLFAVRELYRASDPDVGPDDWRRGRTFPALWVWWAAFLSALALLALAYNGLGAHPSISELMTRDRFVRAGAGLGLVACLLAIVVVESINARVFGKMEALTASSWAAWRDQGGR
jgi:Domain of unknown function (DUF4328)